MIAPARWILAAALAVMVGLAGGAASAEYPDKPIRIIVGFGAGDAIDGTARVIAERMSEKLGVPVVVVNVPGGGGAKGLAQAAQEAPDGYTLVMGSTGALTARPQISDAGYTPESFVTLAQLTEVPIGLAVAKDSPYGSVDEIVEAAKSGTVTYSTPAPGSTQHINMSAFAADNGMTLAHVGGKGGKGAVTKALSGEVDFVFVGASNYTALADSGDLRVIAVASPDRLSYLPDAPTFKEAGHDFTAKVWFGLLAPAGTPEPVLETLRATLDEIANSDETLAVYERFNFQPAYLDHEAFAGRVQENVERHKAVLSDLGLIK